MFGLVITMLVLAAAQSSYAQMSISITGNPSPRETATNRTAETNDPVAGNGVIITGTLLSDVFVTGGRLRITYPAPLTSSTASPAGDAIRISSATGIFACAAIVSTSTTSLANNRVEINLPSGTTATGGAGTKICNSTGGGITGPGAGNTADSTSGTMILEGVRLDVNGATAPLNAAVSLTSYTTGGAITTINPVNVILNTPSFEAITALAPGIGSVAAGVIPSSVADTSIAVQPGTGAGSCSGGAGAARGDDCGVATIFTNRTSPDQVASFTVREGHATAWFNNSATQFPGAAGFTNDGGFKLTFNGIPTGVTLTLAVSAATSGAPALSNTSITTANNTSTVSFGADVSTASGLDAITFRITAITIGSSTTLTGSNITVSASMSPVGNTYSDDTSTVALAMALNATALPRYSEALVGPVTVVSIVSANTTLLVPFALTAGAYDTGIAIANTSADPFGSATGGATPQSGALRLDFFPATATGAGSTFGVTTSATKKAGSGMAADGTVPAGATWTANLSELLPLAGGAAPFTGYVFIRTDFLYAHGAAYIYDGRGFTSSTPVLVMQSPTIGGRAAGANVESLNN